LVSNMYCWKSTYSQDPSHSTNSHEHQITTDTTIHTTLKSKTNDKIIIKLL